MEHSYVFTKRFIDKQVRALNLPLVLDDSLKKLVENGAEELNLDDEQLDEQYDRLTEKLLTRILNRTNIIIRKKNNRSFAPQITNQIAHQIVKLEHHKLLLINDQLASLNAILPPLLLPEFVSSTGLSADSKLAQFKHVISQLPEAKYLLVKDDVNSRAKSQQTQTTDESKDVESTETSEKRLIEDDEEHFSLSRKQLEEKVQAQVEPTDVSSILVQYDEVRQRLIEIYNKLNYSRDKLSYLQDLQAKLTNVLVGDTRKLHEDASLYDSDEEVESTADTAAIQANLDCNPWQSSSTLKSETNRFKVLVEKLDYKLNGQNLRELVTKLNLQN